VVRRQGEIDGRPAFVMDLVPGENLGVMHAKGMPYSGVKCLVDLCGIAAFLHQQDIIHNDLKLENCIFKSEAGGLALVDFGSVRFPRRTSLVERLFRRPPPTVFGTATYLAPELIQGKRPTFRTDVYALGVCAFLMLTGRPPFDESRQSGRLKANLESAPPSIAERLPDIHAGVASILDSCLSKDPEARPMAAPEVHAAAKLHLEKLRESAVHRAKRERSAIHPTLRASLDES
jgi:serine/threonine protein kinase